MKNGFRLLLIVALIFFVNTFFAACVMNAAPVATTTAAKTTSATTAAHTTAEATTKAAEQTTTTTDAESALEKYDTGITYRNMERTPDKYLNQNVQFTGTVFQVIEDEDQDLKSAEFLNNLPRKNETKITNRPIASYT